MDCTCLKKLVWGAVELKQLLINGIQVWKSGYKNWVPVSVDTDGSIFNGCGYADGYRLSSSGVIKAYDASSATGFIPVSGGDVIRIGGCKWYDTTSAMNYLCAYDSNFANIGSCTPHEGGYIYGTQVYGTMTGTASVAVITLADLQNIAYIRVSFNDKTSNAYTGADIIVTVNEEITQ